MVHKSIQLPDSESRSPFSRPDRKHTRHATATDPPRETRSGSFFRCSDGTEERFSGRLRAACRNARRTVPYSRPYAAERTEKPCRRSKRRQQRPHAWPAEPGRKDKEPDRPKRKPTGTRRAYESWGIPVPHAQNHRMPHSIRLRPRIRTGARPKASDRLCLNRAARL